jgi:hypothetical protein
MIKIILCLIMLCLMRFDGQEWVPFGGIIGD